MKFLLGMHMMVVGRTTPNHLNDFVLVIVRDAIRLVNCDIIHPELFLEFRYLQLLLWKPIHELKKTYHLSRIHACK